LWRLLNTSIEHSLYQGILVNKIDLLAISDVQIVLAKLTAFIGGTMRIGKLLLPTLVATLALVSIAPNAQATEQKPVLKSFSCAGTSFGAPTTLVYSGGETFVSEAATIYGTVKNRFFIKDTMVYGNIVTVNMTVDKAEAFLVINTFTTAGALYVKNAVGVPTPTAYVACHDVVVQ
jgi:hypothetical protein